MPSSGESALPPMPGAVSPRWHVAAGCVFALAAVAHGWDWLALDRMPPGDFPGYAAQVQSVREAVLEHGRVPAWCSGCFGGTTRFTGHLKELLALPFALVADPVWVTKGLFLGLKALAALGLYALVALWFRAPGVGIVAGYALSFGAVANHQIEHLDPVLATALLPPTLLAAVALLRRAGAAAALALGALVAVLLVNHWVHALPIPALVIALAAARPWRARDAAGLLPARATAGRWLRGVGGALLVFAALAASQLAWIAADAQHHRLVPPALLERQRASLVERSPFLFVNRSDVLGPWLAEHRPATLQFLESDGERRYLGVVVLAVCALGALAQRRRGDPRLGRWALVAAGMFLFQYGLALGPHTLLWLVGESLHVSAAVQQLARLALWTGAAACLALAATRAVRARRRRDAEGARGALRALGGALLLLFPTVSLWSLCARVLPFLAMQRSPGHFFDTAVFWVALLFATGLCALVRGRSRRQAAALVGLVAAGVAVDFWPSRRAYAEGAPLAPIRRAATLVAGLPGEGGTLRVGLLPGVYSPLASFLLAQSEAGHAWGWLRWQAGRHWESLYAGAFHVGAGPRAAREGGIRSDASLLAAARVRHLLISDDLPPLPAPWRRVGAEGGHALYQQPSVHPLARGYRACARLEEDGRGRPARWVSRALAANTLAVSSSGDAAESGCAEPAPTLGARSARRLPVAPEPIAVRLRSHAPGRIALELDAGAAPAWVSVAEGHHPWWRATVDGAPAPVLRANLALLAVPVGPGRHTVELHLRRPAWVAAADTLTAGAWIALAVAVPLALRRAGGA